MYGSLFAEAQIYGLLWLEVEPSYARVTLDERMLDKGVWLLSLAPGNYRLKIECPSYDIFETDLEILSGQSLHKNISLELMDTPEEKIGGKE